MNTIRKGLPPQELTDHQRCENAGFDNLPTATKDTLRKALCEEQGGLCCYCMSRIQHNSGKPRIEHWQDQAHFKDRDLDYANLLLACHGNEGTPFSQQHCDVRKKSSPLKYNPADPSHDVAGKMRYLMDGTIRSTDSEFDGQLDTVLNLNQATLKRNRKSVIDGFRVALANPKTTVNKGQIQRFLQKWRQRNAQNRFLEYNGVAIYYLEKKLRRFG